MTKTPISIALACLLVLHAGAAVEPHQLRCEYLEHPVGIDVPAPRLQWKLKAPETARGVMQQAYRILVSTDEAALAADQGNLWDSGRVEDSRAVQIVYGGKPLESRRQCFWKVGVWTADGFGWSHPARWEMGLLSPGDWKAKWLDALGYPYVKTGSPQRKVDLKIHKAVYGVEGSNKDVTAAVAARVGPQGIALIVTNHPEFGDPAQGKRKTLTVEYELGGKRGTIAVNEGDTMHLPESYRPDSSGMDSAPYLRKSFDVADKPVRKARLYVSALGLYEMHLNGRRVGDIIFAPEWTDYHKRVHYNVYDVDGMLRKGRNALAGLVGRGWYSGHVGMGGNQHYGKVPALIAQLEITYDDGSVDVIATDETWKAAASPLLMSDFMKGETCDARLETPDWSSPDLDDAAWASATVRSEPVKAVLQGVNIDPVRIVKELPARSVSEPKPGQWTFDLGQNMVGVVRLKVEAKAGTKLTLRYGEMTNPDGTIYTANLRSATSTDTYFCKGGGIEIYQPRFTFHGFRYVEVGGLSAAPGKDMITGLVVASDLQRTSEFSCSDDRLNQLYSNIIWGQRGNFLSIPTDCPQRDERLGWAGDAQVFARTAAFNADVAAFYSKWLVDMRDAQTPEGAFTDVSPRVGFNHGTPGWADAGVICPWTIYQMYGDRRVLEDNYESMVRWVEWCRANSTGLIRDKNRGGDYGDWLSINANTPKEVIGTAYFAYSTGLLAKIAAVLGKTDDTTKYSALFDQIKAAFNQRFVAPDGRIHGNTQSCYLMALKFGLLSDEMREKAVRYLEEDIRARDAHLSTGFIGVSYLLPVLTAHGKADIAYELIRKDTFPSWLFSVKHGATTIWERWDGWTPEKGFQDPGMNSFNHFSLGSCGEWMMSSLAGIDTDGPGFEKLVIRPVVGEGITWVKGSYDSIRGPIATSWKRRDGKFDLEVVVPANTTAIVHVPARAADAVREGDVPAARAKGVECVKHENGSAIFTVGSGRYHFQSEM